MSTKTLLIATVSLIFLTGIALGFGLHDLSSTNTLKPTNSREQAFSDAAEQARLSATNPAENLRVDGNNAARDYSYGLTSGAISVALGGDKKIFAQVADAQSGNLLSLFKRVIGSTQLSTLNQGWVAVNSAYLDLAATKKTNNPVDVTNATAAFEDSVHQVALLLMTVAPTANGPALQNSLMVWAKNVENVLEIPTLGSPTNRITAQLTAAKNLGLVIDGLTAAFVKQSPTVF